MMHLKTDYVLDCMEYSNNNEYLWGGEPGEKDEGESFHLHVLKCFLFEHMNLLPTQMLNK